MIFLFKIASVSLFLLYWPLTSCKVSEKTNERFPRYLKTDGRTTDHGRTNEGDYYGPNRVNPGSKNCCNQCIWSMYISGFIYPGTIGNSHQPQSWLFVDITSCNNVHCLIRGLCIKLRNQVCVISRLIVTSFWKKEQWKFKHSLIKFFVSIIVWFFYAKLCAFSMNLNEMKSTLPP